MLNTAVKRSPLQVAVGVVQNPLGEVLIALRPQHVHQGGLWEFPGGKLQAGESVEQAMQRELQEELNISVQTSSPLISICHDYPELSVQLHVHKIESFSGVASGAEGQEIRWLKPEALDAAQFPLANAPIIKALQLPPLYAILDHSALSSSAPTTAELLAYLTMLLQQGIKLIQIRLKSLSASQLQTFLHAAEPLATSFQASLLLNSALPLTEANHACFGLHLTSEMLMALDTRPSTQGWLAASCHNLAELAKAVALGVDFVVLAPVLPTPTHAGAEVLGWADFAQLTAKTNLPVYALGGLQHHDLSTAKQAGAQGIAGIRLFSHQKTIV